MIPATATQSLPTEPLLFDIPPKPAPRVYGGSVPFQKASATSRAAAERMKSRAPSLRMQVLEFIRGHGDAGATAEEVGAHLAELKGRPSDNTACRLGGGARVTELKLGGFVADSGRRRPTRAGCSSVVWVATAKEGDGRICEKLQTE